MNTKQALFLALALAAMVFTAGCASTRTENGVTIEKQSSLNPLNYIPFL